MTRRRSNSAFANGQARRLPFHVVVAAPSTGLGKQMDDLLAWCEQHVQAGQWFSFGSLYCFGSKADSEAFQQAFKDLSPMALDPPDGQC